MCSPLAELSCNSSFLPNWVCHFPELHQTIILELPYAGIENFNDLWIKSNSFCHLREYFYEPPSLMWPVMESWQLSPRYFETMHHPTSAWNCCLPNWTSVIFPSLSTGALCLNLRCSTSHSVSWSWVARSLRRSTSIEFSLVVIVSDEDLENKDVNVNWSNGSTSSRRAIGSWRSC